ncbi:GNAT family N-acetyltransferase [Gorillibacterium massiliense]|uniref:GNAT family N-acetyltransferase n=1 Tax=Gorillibacterium massiliense TaxID=1280390 RepID=UPI000594C99A|nr:GNAT family N-acetyltransferase [Gorillibacterium massiliense]
MTITYAMNKPISASELVELFTNSGINRSIDNLERIQTMIDNADEIISAWEDDKLVGVLRALTDYSYSCYISELAVHKQFQRLGIGKNLMDLLIEKLGDKEIKYMLTSSNAAIGFYKNCGFEQDERAFVIRRKVN